MAMIVCCHFFQVIGFSVVAFWLNTGVQIFFVLSAYLLCKYTFHSISDVYTFSWKRYSRIMIPLWIYLFTIVFALLVIGHSVKMDAVLFYILGLIAFAPNGILGLGHLWYITAILVCYAMLPVLDILLRRVKWCSVRIVAFILIAAFVLGLFWRFSFIAYGVNVVFFLLMVVIFRKERDRESEKYLLRLCAIPTVIFVTLSIALSKNHRSELSYEILMTTAKCLLAVVLFCVVHLICAQIHQYALVQYLSNISYEVYLTHQFILLFVNRSLNAVGIQGIPNYLITFVASVPIIWIYAVVVNKSSAFVISRLRGRGKVLR